MSISDAVRFETWRAASREAERAGEEW